jgi:hypothetical protein
MMKRSAGEPAAAFFIVIMASDRHRTTTDDMIDYYYYISLFKVFSDEAHMSGSEIDDGTDNKATAWKRRLDILVILKLREAVERQRANIGHRTSQPRDE